MIGTRCGLALVVLAALAPLPAARAQAHAGRYAVQGTDPAHGPFTGQLELRARAGGYDVVRVVELSTARHAGRRISLVWTGSATDVAGGVSVEVHLDRMGWARSGAGVTRTAADGVPARLTASFTGSPSARPSGAPAPLAGAWSSPGLSLPSETWTRTGPPGAAPLWRSERTRTPMHAPPAPAIKSLLFGLLSGFHGTTWVSPYVPRPEFQAAVHHVVRDPTDFDLHRREPDLLRVTQQVLDPLALAEARVKADAYGPTLRRKAELADAEAPALFDPLGACAYEVGGVRAGNGDGGLWTGTWALSQSLRWQLTQDPAALRNVELASRCWVIQCDIDGDPADFARTIRTAGGHPVGPPGAWVAGTGPYAGIEWLTGGNNDMFKGLILTGLAAHEALPPGDPLRAELGRGSAELAAHSPVARGGTSQNAMLAHGVSAMLTGSSAERDAYRRSARNPFRLLTGLFDGGFLVQGISDWSGNHLGFCGLYSRVRVAHHLGETFESWASRLALYLAERRLSPARQPLQTIAAAGRSRFPLLPPPDAADAIWSLREVPMPRADVEQGHALKATFCMSPYPSVPWKFDFMTQMDRSQGIDAFPRFEQAFLDYMWKDNPLVAWPNGPIGAQFPSPDYLLAYWLARAEGVIGPND